jgi:hypothetical protein
MAKTLHEGLQYNSGCILAFGACFALYILGLATESKSPIFKISDAEKKHSVFSWPLPLTEVHTT